MTDKTKKVELLAPAGNFEKLQIAIHYGADAVYLADKDFGLRNFSENFTLDELGKAVELSHKNDINVYVACNIYARNFDQKPISDYLVQLGDIGPDAVIVSDPGIFMEARRVIPEIPLHLSTQANTTNYKSALFWKNLGAQRINVARELSLKEIKEIAHRSGMEIEAFVHGAMCISYSGRCLLSNFMAKRDSNRGMCSHSCRWKYALMEELRPDKYYPVVEDNRGSYIFNSRDLCMIEHLPEMIESGIISLKIEGRMKGINYVASTVKVYREALDAYLNNPEGYRIKKEWIEELAKISNRGYSTGFYLGDPEQITAALDCKNSRGPVFIGKVLNRNYRRSVTVDVRNKIFKGEFIEIMSRKGPVRQDKINDIFDENGHALPFAQPGNTVTLTLNSDCLPNDLIRRRYP
ncbi:U32 family peptidase [Thermodesulfobacteriota bacterium]